MSDIESEGRQPKENVGVANMSSESADYSKQNDLIQWTRNPLVKGTDRDLGKCSFDELLRKFQKCHDEIWEGGKLDPASAFDEFSKLLMTKIYDERFTPFNEEYRFQIKRSEKPRDVAEKIRKCYEQVQEKNSGVFRVDIKLSDEIIFEVVKILQEVSLRLTDLDVKGRAFEIFLGKVFRDEYGQYFTPRNIVKFMVEVVDPDENDTIIDPACGSGGFLLYSLMHVTDKVLKRYKDDKDALDRIVWDFAHKQIFGIEINDRIARISMMDMVIHEDGHSNIECNNALANYDEFDKRRDIKPNKYSILLTNPPFGAIIKDRNLLSKFELGIGRDSQKTEILFIERSIEFLKPNGILGIVLPDSILTNSSLQYVRDYILKKARITAIVSLPQHTFVPSGAGVKSSLLFLEKNDGQEMEECKIFMAVAKHIGYDSRGKEDSNDLTDILYDWKEYTKHGASFKKSFAVCRHEMRKRFSPEQFVFYSNHKEWKTKTLSKLCDDQIFTGRSPARRSYPKEGYKILKVRDLTGKGIDWDNEERAFVSRDFCLKNQSARLKENDILFISGAHHPKYIGQKIDIVDKIPERFKEGVICSAQLMVLRINPKHIDPYYVLLFLKTKDGYRAIQSCIRGQTAHIYPKDIKNVEIPIPPEEELNRMKNDIENIKEYLKKKGEANEKYIESLKSAMTLMESD
jgi:type I restriction enzyme M protein